MKTGIVSAGSHCLRSLLVLLLALPAGLPAAEVRGLVTLQHSGLFAGRASGERRIGLALWPDAPGLAAETPAPVEHELRIDADRIRPGFLQVRPGEPIRLVNLDPIEHRLFALVPGAHSEVDVRLRPSGTDAQSIRFTETGTRHLFCRLHRRSYARIDVVDAPRLAIVNPGERFEFRDLQAGRWRLRVAGIGAETLELDTIAMIAPPPLNLRLPVHEGVQPEPGAEDGAVSVEQLYPAAPVK